MDRCAGPPEEARPTTPTASADTGLLTRLEDVATMACHGVPGCDDAALTIAVDGGVFTVGATSGAASDLEAEQHLRGSGPGCTARRGRTVVSVDDYRLDVRWPHVSRAAAAHGVRSTLSLPLLHGNAVLGVLSMHGRLPAAFGRRAVQVGEVLARQASGVILHTERARRTGALLAVEREIAQTLQRALIPVLPRLPGVVTAGRYVPAEGAGLVGGDWYDVFPLAPGSIGLAIGDVMGHGIGAAHGMSQLRTALRICASESPSPAEVFDRLDRHARSLDLALTTAVYGTLALQQGGAELLFCNAGHPPPLVRWPDGGVSQVESGSSWLLGGPTAQLGQRRDAALQLPSGAVLVLYTDGLVERRGRHLAHGISMLGDALAGAPLLESPETLCDRLIGGVCEDGSADDLALLVVLVC